MVFDRPPELRLRLLELAFTGPAFRAKDVDLLFSFRMRRLGCGVGGLLLAKIDRCLLCLLHGAGAFRDEILVARILLLREGECGFRLACLLRGLFDARLLLLELCIGVGDRCLRYLGLGLGLVDRGAIIAIIDARENRARLDKLIVRDRNRDKRTGHLRAHRHGTPVDEGIVGRFVMTRAEPPDDGSRHRRDGQDRDQACRKLVPADQVLDAAFALRLWLFPTALLGGTPVPLPAFDDALALCGTPVPAFLVAVAQRLPPRKPRGLASSPLPQPCRVHSRCRHFPIP
jgi:hypothetical protein